MYYRNCPSLRKCNDLIAKYWDSKQYNLCFSGHLHIAYEGYPLAECQVGYFYYAGIGCNKDFQKALYWTYRSALHGDRDAQFNLDSFYEDGIFVLQNISVASFWYNLAASQGQKEARQKLKIIEAK